MTFREVLAQEYRAWLKDAAPWDLLVFAGRMYDLCKNEYEIKRKIDLFRKIDRRLGFFAAISDRKEDTESIFSRYACVSDLTSEKVFRSLIVLVKEVVDKDGECYYPQATPDPLPIPSKAPSTPRKTAPQAVPEGVRGAPEARKKAQNVKKASAPRKRSPSAGRGKASPRKNPSNARRKKGSPIPTSPKGSKVKKESAVKVFFRELFDILTLGIFRK